MIYGKGHDAYRIPNRVIDPQNDEPGIVHILHVRHAARQRPGLAGDTEDQDAP